MVRLQVEGELVKAKGEPLTASEWARWERASFQYQWLTHSLVVVVVHFAARCGESHLLLSNCEACSLPPLPLPPLL